MKKFYTDIEALCGLTVVGTTSLSTATGVTVATSDNSTKLATTAFVKSVVSGYVPTTRTITINGTTYDLSANRSWTISTADGYVSNVVLNGSLLEFTGVGSAFSGSIDLSSITPVVRTVYETVKNVSGATILKGTPLAVVAGQTSGNVSDVVPANAADPTKMPAVFIANQNIADQAEGEAILFGYLQGVNTSAYTSGTTVYVAAGGGWTATKPVWPNKIQNLGVITKQHATNGAGIVTGVGRANDLPNLTAGKIWVGTANYPIESTTVHIDEANTRMGVGTSSIEGGLHINYSAANTLLMQRISPDSGPPEAIGRKARGTVSAKTGVLSGDRLWFFAAAGYYGTEGIDGAWSANKVGMNFVASETWTPSAQGTHITWATTAAGQTTRTDKMILTGTGDLGIGTATPASKLHAVGSSTTELRLQNSDANNNYGFVKYETQNVSGGNLVIGTNASGGGYGAMLFIADNNIDFLGSGDLRIVKSGNVGIGTYSPTAKLHTVGTGIVNVVQSLNTVSYTQYYNTSTGTNTTNDGLTVGINGLDAYVYQREAANLIFGTSDAERMRITDTGNVGIGTTSPARKLDIVSTNAQIRISDGTANTYWEIMSLFFQSNQDFIIQNQNNVGILINSSGNVGLGTATPGAKIHVVGTESRFGGVASGFISVYNATGRSGYIQANGGTDLRIASDSDPMTMYVNGSERMRITAAGNIGIGTTTPDTPLSTARGIVINSGASNDVQIRMQNNTTGSTGSDGGLLSISGAQMYLWNYEASNLIFGTSNSERMRIDSSGNLGVGITSPSYKLDVFGGFNAVTSGVNITYDNGILYHGNYYQITSGNNYLLYARGGGALLLGSDDVERVRIASNGNVGIGTTSPEEKLHVAGGNILISNGQYYGVESTTGGNYKIAGLTTGNLIVVGAIDYTSAGTIFAGGDNVSFTTGGVGGSTRIKIASSGNVGIGVDPVSGDKFEVAGTLRVHTGNNWDGIQIYSGGQDGYIRGLGDEIGLHIRSEYGNVFIADDRGKVAIGTTATPQKKLDVNGSGIVASFGAAFGAGDFAGIHFGYSETIYGNDSYKKSALVFERTDNHGQGGNASGKIHFLLNNLSGNSATNLTHSVFTIDTDAVATQGSARVGIGTSSPQEAVHAKGNIRIDGSSTAAILETGDRPAATLGSVFETYDIATTYGAFVDYIIYDTNRDNMRNGTFRATWNLGQAVYTDTSTVDIGDTSSVVLTAVIDGANVKLIVTGDPQYTIKYNVKLIK